jgi:hypothetical protein
MYFDLRCIAGYRLVLEINACHTCRDRPSGSVQYAHYILSNIINCVIIPSKSAYTSLGFES